MARTRAQRRRLRITMLTAVVVVASVVVFVRDVMHAAHTTRGNTQSVARTFAALASTHEEEWLTLSQNTTALLNAGPTLTPAQDAGQWALYGAELARESASRSLLVTGVSDQIVDRARRILADREQVWHDIANTVAATLRFRHTTGVSSAVLTVDQQRLAADDVAWQQLARSIHRLHLGANLHTGRTSLASGQLVALVQTTTTASSLTPIGGVAFATLLVSPQPLPVAGATLELLPVSSIALGVSVTNTLQMSQTATIDVQLQTTDGHVTYHDQEVVPVAGAGAAAITLSAVPVTANERATLRIQVRAPFVTGPTVHTWTVHVAP